MKILRYGQRRAAGYTLIEMTIVLFIILAFLAMSVPFFANFSTSAGLRTAEREILTALRTTRSYATSQNEAYQLVCGTDNTYRIVKVSDSSTIGKTYQLPQGISFPAASRIRFSANGGLAGDSPNGWVKIVDTKGHGRTLGVHILTTDVTPNLTSDVDNRTTGAIEVINHV